MAPFLGLAGFMGSGKTSVGARVAALLAWKFIDLDEEFVSLEGSIPDFFASKGEAAFRAREVELLEEITTREDSGGVVLALGGGTLESPRARRLLGHQGGLVLLDVEPAQAWARVQNSDRPLAGDRERFRALLARRRHNYESTADWVLRVGDKGVEELSCQLADMIGRWGEQWQDLWGRDLARTERCSSIIGGKNALSTLHERAVAAHGAGSRFYLLTDENVMEAWGEQVLELLGGADLTSPLVLEPGEASKSALTLERCWNWLAESGARRDDIVVALGGGVVGDLAGFAAATYHRGVSLWQVPTSLVAQVDSSVGGKTAINLPAGKNLVGAFYQPDLVLIDPVTLATLPAPEYVGGLGEVVKYALLMSGESLGDLEEDAAAVIKRDMDAVSRVAKSSVAYKTSVVMQDEREKGWRAVLNLGHTTAHALEVVEGYGSLRHGEAVSLGLLVALAVSERLLDLDQSVRERTRVLLERFGLPTSLRLPSKDVLLEATRRDKKTRALSSGFVGLRGLGEPVWGLDVPPGVYVQALEVIKQ